MMAEAPTSYEAPLKRFAAMVRRGTCAQPSGEVHCGVDLGTANIVVGVVDAANQPVTGAWKHDTVVRDGVVVDYVGAAAAVRALTRTIEQRLGRRLTRASVAIPPGIPDGDIKVFVNVVNAADLDVDEIVDEPVAAARVLGVRDGCVIDVGHGTTGVSVLEGGRVVHSVDQATGGHHMTLVLAGAYRQSYDAAEAMKKDARRQDDVIGVIRPTLEKMATIARDALIGYDPPLVYLVGGASSFSNAPDVFSQILNRPVVRPIEPLFVTPLGVPMIPQDTPSMKGARHG